MSGGVDLAALAGQQQPQINPWVLRVSGQVVVRQENGLRVLCVIQQQGILVVEIPLDPINAASIARDLSPVNGVPAGDGPAGLSVET